MADIRDIILNLLGKETVSKAAGSAEKGLGKLGDKFDDTADHAGKLDKQIGEVNSSLKSLAEQYARTGDDSFVKQIRAQQRELRKLTQVKGLLDGGEAAEKFGVQFVSRLGPLIARAPLGPAGAALGVIIGVPLAAGIGAAVAGGVLGAAGGGGVIGGIAIASRDARVQAAAKSLGDSFASTLEQSAIAFVPATLRGIGIIQSELQSMRGDLEGIFAGSARYVEPLVRGITGLVRNALPGIRTAVEAAAPVIRELSDGLPRIGRAISDVLTDISGNADEGASAVRGLMMGLESGIRTVGAFVTGLADLYRVLLDVGLAGAITADALTWDHLPIVGERIANTRDRLQEMKDALEQGGEKGAEAGTEISGGFQKVTSAASTATAEVEGLAEMVDRLTGENLSAERSEIRLEEAIDAATEAGRKNNDGIDRGTAKGRANRSVLLDLAEAAKANAADILKMTGSQDLASQATEKGRAAFLKSAAAMGVSKEEAIKLANKLFGLPNIKRTVTVETKKAEANTRTVAGLIAAIKSKRVVITIDIRGRQTVRVGGRNIPIGDLGGLAHGGPVEGPGPKGVDSQLRMLAPGEHVLTAREVDAAGGHKSIERWRKSLTGGGERAATSVLARPAMASGGGGGINHFHFHGPIGSQMELENWLTRAVDSLRRKGRM